MTRFEIPERRGAELVARLQERDEYAQGAQKILDAKNATIEAIIIGQLQAAGHDPDAPRGAVQCQRERDGKYYLTVQDVQAQAGSIQLPNGQAAVVSSNSSAN